MNTGMKSLVAYSCDRMLPPDRRLLRLSVLVSPLMSQGALQTKRGALASSNFGKMGRVPAYTPGNPSPCWFVSTWLNGRPTASLSWSTLSGKNIDLSQQLDALPVSWIPGASGWQLFETRTRAGSPSTSAALGAGPRLTNFQPSSPELHRTGHPVLPTCQPSKTWCPRTHLSLLYHLRFLFLARVSSISFLLFLFFYNLSCHPWQCNMMHLLDETNKQKRTLTSCLHQGPVFLKAAT